MPVHKVMDHTGHSTIEIDPENSEEVKAGMERFNELIGRGFTAARLESDGKQVVTRDYDPDAVMLFIPALQGG